MKSPVIQLIVNNEDFLTRRHLDKIIQRLVDPETRDFNFDHLSARDISVDQFIAILKTLPMMSPSRLVVIKDFDVYLKSSDKTKTNTKTEALINYFKDPNPQTHVIMVAEKADKRTSFIKQFSKTGEIREFKPLYSNQIPQFIDQEAKELGLTLEPGCAEFMAETIGTNLMSVISELSKLGLFVLPEKKIFRQHVKDLVTSGLVENVFMITNLIGQKKYAEVFKLYSRMKEQGEPIIKLIALIINHFRKLLKTRAVMQSSQRQDAGQLAQQLGVHRFFVKDYVNQAKRFSTYDLNRVYQKLMGLSVGIRSNGPSPETLFESFLQEQSF